MEREFVLDIHTHTIASGHAYGTIREMAQAAAEQHLQMYGFSDHGPGIPGTADFMYFGNQKVIPRTLYGVKIVHGCEMNVANDGTIMMPEVVIQRLDYGIVGIHSFCYKDAGKEKNTENLISCMKHPNVFFVSHPDDDHTPLDYEKLVLAAKEYHVALEVNNSSLHKPESRWNCVENYHTMLKLCMEHRVPVIVNSDAHDPSAVGDFELAANLLDEVGFDQELVLNRSVEAFLQFIHREDLL
ncbi:MAG: phosphatase [Erysipelotrichaceae bacterium]|nr:phosphatase [Erysipelotrichaceae bacterium]